MSWQHLQTFLWLQWRIRMNQMRRAGVASVVVLTILAVAVCLLATVMFCTLVLVGLFALPKAPAPVLMLVWDGLAVAFLFFWMIGLFTELQRAELFSLDKFLHLPVSLTSAFLINYVGSLASLSLAIFLPAMIGLAIALVFSKGPAMLALFPLLAGFVLVVTALTYQFRGWLAALMVNKRRRRTVIMVVTVAFILLVQLPNLVNGLRPWSTRRNDEVGARKRAEIDRLGRALAGGQINPAQYRKQLEAIESQYQVEVESLRGRQLQELEHIATVVNLAIPLGWLPYGAMAAAQGKLLPALWGTIGLGLIAAASLRRSYRTTLRLYTGQFSTGRTQVQPAESPIKPASATVGLLERQLPLLSDQAAAITLACFRSLTRAPEAKMMLLSPIILLVVFGGMFLTRTRSVPEFVRPLMATGAIVMILFSMIQLMGNQFGFDRSGFRTFVLSSACRKDVLLGKNLAFVPLALGMSTVAVALLQCVYPMRVDHFLATLAQMISMYLVFCVVANFLSIFAPMPIASGTLKPANPKALTVLIHVAFMFVFPVALGPTLFPLGLEFLLRWLGYLTWFPWCLVLTLAELLAVISLYPVILRWQGRVLQAREQKILEVVTAKVE